MSDQKAEWTSSQILIVEFAMPADTQKDAVFSVKMD